MKEKIYGKIKTLMPDMKELSDSIFDNPECGFEEYKAAASLTGYLEKNDFKVERGIAGLPTAFRAIWSNGTGGPNIGFLGEYDALRVIGHACGHHMQTPACIAAAMALREAVGDAPVTITVYGTPAEETTGGKITMLREGFIKELDVALGCHSGTNTRVSGPSKAIRSFIVTYKGIPSHASGSPQEGRSALDTAILSFNGIEFMREHVRDDSRMHYSILENTGPSNVVHEKAVVIYTLRSNSNTYLDQMVERFHRILQGACLMTDATCEIKPNANYDAMIPLKSLIGVAQANMKESGTERYLDTIPEAGGSTDFGNVSCVVPTCMVYVSYCDAPSHSQAWVDAGKTEKAAYFIEESAKIMAGTAWDLLQNPAVLDEMKQELEAKLKTE